MKEYILKLLGLKLFLIALPGKFSIKVKTTKFSVTIKEVGSSGVFGLFQSVRRIWIAERVKGEINQPLKCGKGKTRHLNRKLFKKGLGKKKSLLFQGGVSAEFMGPL